MTPILLDLALRAGFSDPIEGWMGEAYEERLEAFAKLIIEHEAAKPAEQPADESVACNKWEGAEYWMPLAWELCADECGEEACTELIWEGGPIPEPWGDRWLKYEDEAKRLIALVQKHTRPQPAAQEQQLNALRNEAWNSGVCPVCNSKDEPQPSKRKPLTDEEIHNRYKAMRGDKSPRYIEIYRDCEAAHGITGEQE